MTTDGAVLLAAPRRGTVAIVRPLMELIDTVRCTDEDDHLICLSMFEAFHWYPIDGEEQE